MDIRIEESDSSVAEVIQSKLLESLQDSLVQSDNTNFVLSARSSANLLIGGLTVSTSYGWLLVKVLWVDEAYRNQGVGRLLMEKAEAKGGSLGCHSVWLDTSNADARTFYETLGYEIFGELSNDAGKFPEDHRRWFLKKSLQNLLSSVSD